MITKKILIYISFIILFLIGLNSCAPTRYIPKNKYMLNKVKIICKKSKLDSDDFEPFLKQKPIHRTFRIAFQARVYNIINPNKNAKRNFKDSLRLVRKNEKIIKKYDDKSEELLRSKKKSKNLMLKAQNKNDILNYKKYELKYIEDSLKYGERIVNRQERLKDLKKEELKTFANYIQKIGEAPEIFDPVKINKTYDQFYLFLKSKGYYNSKIDSTIKYKRRKKVNIKFIIIPNQPTVIEEIVFNTKDSLIRNLLLENQNSLSITKNSNLDIELLQTMRDEITSLMNNNGYFNFTKQYIKLLVDTINRKNKALLNVNIENSLNINDSANIFVKYKINKVNIFSDYNPQLALEFPDTYTLNLDTFSILNDDSIRYEFIKKEELIVKPDVLINDIYIFPDSVYSLANVKATYKHLSSFKIYKLSNIQFVEIDTINHLLDCNILLTPTLRQSRLAEIQGTNTGGNIGATSNLKYQHKNLFKGGEIFDLKFSLTLESHKISYDSTSGGFKFRGFNTQEYSLDGSIEMPKLLIPFKYESFVKRHNPKTIINLGFSYQNRPEYIRTMASTSIMYYWKRTENTSNSFTPIRFSLIRVPADKMDSLFNVWINKSLIKESYEDQFIFGTNFSLSFSNQNVTKRNFFYIKFNTSTAGNTLLGLIETGKALNLMNLQKNDNGSYNLPLFKTVFAQFGKADIDFRFYNIIDKKNTFVYRLFLGAGLPYLNSNLLPFSEQYFTGGSNGIRAWQVRSLGPGTYKVIENKGLTPFQSADVKIEGNFEYRLKIVGIFEGAFFIDYGNIWAINEYDNRVGAQFNIKKFYKEIAIGSGLGLRLDISLFVVRFDLGIKVKDPILPEGKRWIYGNRKYTFDDLGYNFGIGYPF